MPQTQKQTSHTSGLLISQAPKPGPKSSFIPQFESIIKQPESSGLDWSNNEPEHRNIVDEINPKIK